MHEFLRVALFALSMILTVPEYDGPWPTLGPLVCDFIETYLVHGPGDMRGKPVRLDDEKRGLIYRAYEVYPQEHPRAGRRRFKRVGISLRKGSAKTEWAALLVEVELDPDGPVRFDGWNGKGDPLGRPVTDPFIPMVAYTEEQSEELAYGALLAIVRESGRSRYLDAGEERIRRLSGDGKAVALASSPDGTDGARTTFQHFDETHRFTSPKLRKAHRTMLANIPKRKLADAWSLETTTAPAPGEDSIAERTMQYAQSIYDGKRQDADLFFFHRQADETKHDLTKPDGVRAAVIEASGPAIVGWSDIDGIVGQFFDPTADTAYLRRVWLNQLVRASDKAFDPLAWARRARPGYQVQPGALITLGFDGAVTDDATALIATEVPTGFQFPLGIWERPFEAKDWHVPEARVDEAVADAFARYNVWRMYADPWYWESWVATWSGRYGDRVVRWKTNLWLKMADCIDAYDAAMRDDQLVSEGSDGDAEPSPAAAIVDVQRLSHPNDEVFTRHIRNAYRMFLNYRDDKGSRRWVIQKESPASPNKMDGAMAGSLSWQARLDCIASGDASKKTGVYEKRGPLVFGGPKA